MLSQNKDDFTVYVLQGQISANLFKGQQLNKFNLHLLGHILMHLFSQKEQANWL